MYMEAQARMPADRLERKALTCDHRSSSPTTSKIGGKFQRANPYKSSDEAFRTPGRIACNPFLMTCRTQLLPVARAGLPHGWSESQTKDEDEITPV